MTPADKAWIALGLGVLVWDMAAPEGQTLSEGADSYMASHPWVTRAVGVTLTAHVLNVLKPEYDIIHWLFVLSRKWRRP